jgi:hypothetical protein
MNTKQQAKDSKENARRDREKTWIRDMIQWTEKFYLPIVAVMQDAYNSWVTNQSSELEWLLNQVWVPDMGRRV